MATVRQAVILAAGLGSRLRGTFEDQPKGFLRLGDLSIIEESLGKLISAGITDIVIVTGYCHEVYDLIAEKFPFVRTVFNPDYATTGSMLSLAVACQCIHADFLLLESDLIYEFSALQTLQNSPDKNIILLSGKTGSGDEVYVGIQGDRIVNMSKSRKAIGILGGELVGISKISRALALKMAELGRRKTEKIPQYHYEDCLTDLSNTEAIRYECIEDLAWMEIDDSNHLHKAHEKIYPLIQQRDANLILSKKVSRNILLNPGPATTTDTVKYAMVVEDICPREKDFGELVESIRNDLVRVVHGEETYVAVLFASSGTGGVEACLSSVVPHGKSVLIINNGAYGQRMQQMCDGLGVDHIDYNIAWGETIDTEKVQGIVEKAKQAITHIALVHHETTVGILNHLSEISRIAKKYEIEIIVDAMSSYAGIPIDIKNPEIHYLIASSNKCIQGMAGLSFVICQKEALERTREIKPRNFYFNLFQNYVYFKERHEMQFTPPVQVFYALRQAINEYFLETEQGRANRYAQMYEVLVQGLEELGFRFLVEKKYHAKILTAIIEPQDEHYSFGEMHDFLFQRGFTIYPGKGAAEKTFRLANMGAITEKDINGFLSYLKDYLNSRDIKRLSI